MLQGQILQNAGVYTTSGTRLWLLLLNMHCVQVTTVNPRKGQILYLHITSTSLCCYYSEKTVLTYRVSQEECARLRESVPYVKLYRYNPKHVYPKLNGYRDNGQRSLKLWQLLLTYWLPNTYWNWQEYVVSVMLIAVRNIKVILSDIKPLNWTRKTLALVS